MLGAVKVGHGMAKYGGHGRTCQGSVCLGALRSVKAVELGCGKLW